MVRLCGRRAALTFALGRHLVQRILEDRWENTKTNRTRDVPGTGRHSGFLEQTWN